MTALYLNECPLQCYRWSVTAKGAPLEWEEFVSGLISLYDPSNTVNYEGELVKLKQEGLNYDEYQVEFMLLSHHVYDLSQKFLVHYFISGLRDAVKYEVMAKRPSIMIEVMRLAKLRRKEFCNQKKFKATTN